MYMKVGKGLNIRILDSLNFLPMPLANSPKSFDLKEMKKGFFPHLYNTTELSCLPEKSYYDPDGMSKERRAEFLQWYEEHKNDSFDFQKEMKEYCISDVDILLHACLKFRDLLKYETGEEVACMDNHDMLLKTVLQNAVDPFSYLIIASVCMGVFRSKFLKENWKVLTEENAQKDCKNETNCTCEWLEGRRLNASSPLEVLVEDEWITSNNLKIVKEKFQSSSIDLIPSHGYSGNNNHSKESIEWLNVLQQQWCGENGKKINI